MTNKCKKMDGCLLRDGHADPLCVVLSPEFRAEIEHALDVTQCAYRAGVNETRCCLHIEHEGPHRFKCASKRCPGFPWLASNTPHPVPPCF